MAYCLPIAVIAIYLMQQTCQATTTVIEPSASIDTATINIDSVTPTETMVAATEAVSMTPSAGAGGANAATSSTNNPMMTTSTQGKLGRSINVKLKLTLSKSEPRLLNWMNKH